MLELLSPYLSFSYWFAQYSEPFTGKPFWFAIGASGGAIGLGILIRLALFAVHEQSWRRAMKRLSVMGVSMGVLIGVSFFFTQTSTPVLGSRFWFLLWGVVAILWVISIVKYLVVAAPRERAARKEVANYQKYLPKGAK
jgi:hypothetical protein